MIREGIFHPQLLRVLGEVRHMDTIVIGDPGLPIPKGVERIDLGWVKGEPPFHKVLEEILKVMVVEHATFANEAKAVCPDFLAKSLSMLPEGIEVEYVEHAELKRRSADAKAIILTGDFTGYTNVILLLGCAY